MPKPKPKYMQLIDTLAEKDAKARDLLVEHYKMLAKSHNGSTLLACFEADCKLLSQRGLKGDSLVEFMAQQEAGVTLRGVLYSLPTLEHINKLTSSQISKTPCRT